MCPTPHPHHITELVSMNSNITMSDPESSCKYFLYRTVGSADQVAVEAGFKVCDLAHLAPSALTIAFLLYSLPRTRHKLSGAPPLVAATHIQLYIAVTTQIVRWDSYSRSCKVLDDSECCVSGVC